MNTRRSSTNSFLMYFLGKRFFFLFCFSSFNIYFHMKSRRFLCVPDFQWWKRIIWKKKKEKKKTEEDSTAWWWGTCGLNILKWWKPPQDILFSVGWILRVFFFLSLTTIVSSYFNIIFIYSCIWRIDQVSGYFFFPFGKRKILKNWINRFLVCRLIRMYAFLNFSRSSRQLWKLSVALWVTRMYILPDQKNEDERYHFQLFKSYFHILK